MQRQILIYAFLVLFLFTGNVLYAEETNEKVVNYNDYERFVKVVKMIQDKYVDEVDIKDIFHNAYKGMLSGLDSYSQFFGEEELADLKVETEGEFEGLGIEVVVKKGMLKVISPIVDSPAMRGGILAGDIILKIDGKPADDMAFREIIKSLRGEPGSYVTLTVLHIGEAEPVDITIKRAKVQVISVRGVRIVDEEHKVGYLAITNFQDHTMEDLKTAIADLKNLGVKSIVLDLRFNPGGLLNVAIEVSDQFLKKGIIVSTKGREESEDITYKAHRSGALTKYPMVVLVNNGSASASEIVAGAIKDNKRGVLAGTKTFGKGSVQSLIPIEDGKVALKITTARYYTPSGVSIHEKGIVPDSIIELTTEELKELHKNLALINSAVAQEKANGKHNKEPNDTVFIDKQLENAINILIGNESIPSIGE